METKNDVLEGIPLAETTPVTGDYAELVVQVQDINVKLDTLCNISVVLLVGLGIVAGVLCSNIFSRYFRS